jgi:hypothetical protein
VACLGAVTLLRKPAWAPTPLGWGSLNCILLDDGLEDDLVC